MGVEFRDTVTVLILSVFTRTPHLEGRVSQFCVPRGSTERTVPRNLVSSSDSLSSFKGSPPSHSEMKAVRVSSNPCDLLPCCQCQWCAVSER